MKKLIALFMALCFVGVEHAQSQTVNSRHALEETKKIERLVILDNAKIFIVELPFNIVKNSPRNLSLCAKGVVKGLWNTGKELCYMAFDIVKGSAIGARLFLKDKTAQADAVAFAPKSGLVAAIKAQGVGATVVEMPRAIFESTVANLLSGDPEKAGEFITNTAILVAPVPKAVSAIQKAGASISVTGGQAAFALAGPMHQMATAGGAVSVSISAEALAAATQALVTEGAAAVPLSSMMMAQAGRPTGRIVWEKWDCPQCGSEGISARPKPGETQPHCPNCGIAKPEGTKGHLEGARDANGKIISHADDAAGEAEMKVAKGGKDWGCAHCGSTNRNAVHSCVSCGAPREALRAIKKTPPTPNIAPSSKFPTGLVVGGIATAGAVGGGLYYFLKTEEVEGRVERMSWSHTYTLMDYVQTTKRAWKHDIYESSPRMPINGSGESSGAFNIRGCTSEFYEWGPEYACGTESYMNNEVVGTKTEYRALGNGAREEVEVDVYGDVPRTRTKYCKDPIDKLKCDYSTYEWQSVTSRSLTGEGKELVNRELPWPKSFDLQSTQKQVPSEKYIVQVGYKFKGDNKSHNIEPSSEAAYLGYDESQRFKLTVNRLGVQKIE